jgi:hypothetical protein
MEAKIYKTLAVIFIATLILLNPVFANNSIKSYFGNSNFQFEENSDLIHIEINKKPWESFTFAIDNVEVMNNPVVNFQISASQSVNLRVDLTDGFFMSSEIAVLQNQVQKSNDFQTITFDFSEMISNIDLTENVFLVIYVNPGETFCGEVAIKNFELTDDKSPIFETNETPGFNIYPSPATTFTNVEIPATGINTIKIFDMSGKEVVVDNVEFYSGTIYFVELSNIPSGYYTVQLSGSETVLTEKLIVR